MSKPSDFVIENGVLRKYAGPGGDVVIPEGITIIEYDAFQSCKSLTRVTIPGSVTSIGGTAFRDCTELTSVTIPEGVTVIGWGVFSGCRSLTDVTIPKGVTGIGGNAFSGCRSLTDVTIPAGVTCIGDCAFSDCRSLTSVTIPDSVTSIDEYAFYGCESLTSIALPESLKKASEYCFTYRSTINLVRVKKWNPAISALLRNVSVGKILAEDFSSLPAKYRPAGALGFISEKHVETETENGKPVLDYLIRNAGKLAAYAMDHPELLYFLCEKRIIKAKDIDAYTTEAEKRADTEMKALLLNYQNALGSAAISKAREKKEKATDDYVNEATARIAARDPAKGISGMTFVIAGKITGWPHVWENTDEIREYLESYGARLGASVTKKTDYLVTSDMNSGSERNKKAEGLGVQILTEADFNEMIGRRFKDAPQITIPSWLKEIPQDAFYDCQSLTSVMIPKGVKSIGVAAFRNCIHLTDVTIPDSVRIIKNYAFQSCRNLTSVTIPEGVTTIGSGVFKSCEALADREGFVIVNGMVYDYCGAGGDISIPENVSILDSGCFMSNHKIKSVTIPDSVTAIGRDAFAFCENMIHVMIPESVTKIGMGVFSKCKALTSVVIPKSVTEIERETFKGCSSLTSVTIPEGVAIIECEAFKACSALTDVTLPRSLTEIGFDAFTNCAKLMIHAPAGSYAEQYAKKNKIKFVAIAGE